MFRRTIIALSLATAIYAAPVYATEEAPADSITNFPSTDGHYVYGLTGISFIDSKLDFGWSSGNPHIGWDWQIGYEWISKKGFGVGFVCDGYLTSGHIQVGSYDNTEKFLTYFIGPYLAFQYSRPGSRWAFGADLGIGLAMTVDEAKLPSIGIAARDVSYGLGTLYSLNADYRLNYHWSLVGRLSCSGGNFGFEKTESGEENKGLSRINISAGAKYQF